MIHSWQECSILDDANTTSKKTTKELKRSCLVENDCKISNNRPAASNSNKNATGGGIVDLNSIDRDKIAKLIRELGYLEIEKQKLNEELNKTKSNCNKQITDYATRERDLIKTKEDLKNKLSKKDEQILDLKNQISIKTTEISPPLKMKEVSDEFNLIPHSSFAGPPKLKNSHQIQQQLMTQDKRSTSKAHLLKEQKELLKEKEWLQIILKQQKCIRKLQRNVDKVDRNKSDLKNNNNDNYQPTEIIKPEIRAHSCTQTEVSQRPIVLNESPVENVPIIDRNDAFQKNYIKKQIVNNEEDLLISVLNDDTTRPNSSLSSKSSISLQLLSSTSSTNKLIRHNQASSLIKIVDIIDDNDDDNAGDKKAPLSSFNVTTSFFNTKLTGPTNELDYDSPISDYLNNNTINSNTDFSDSTMMHDNRNSPPSFLLTPNPYINNDCYEDDDDLISELFFPT